ncbi:hypothetical protein [Paracoccus sp. TOH]|uniref:hypothetical protein n=1 Tax=Paracoccus sp. TOH TaxID=1263728 RepID=UPI0025B01485|nr:hypothetical protein [Paracoccus sp. TOH]WJS83536.1 hypothetical protein NBE95_07065 [Paracoccus sp. TOH]
MNLLKHDCEQNCPRFPHRFRKILPQPRQGIIWRARLAAFLQARLQCTWSARSGENSAWQCGQTFPFVSRRRSRRLLSRQATLQNSALAFMATGISPAQKVQERAARSSSRACRSICR